MHYVYLLLLNNQEIYTGSTAELRTRVAQHQHGQVRSTRGHRPLKLVYYEAYLYKQDAEAREKYLKTGDGRRSIQKQLQYLLNSTRP